MKNLKLLVFTMVFMFSLVGVSAYASSPTTLVAGKIYDADFNEVVGAEVVVTCGVGIENVTSGEDGSYTVSFKVGECNVDDDVTVVASKDGFLGYNDGIVLKHDFGYMSLDLAVVNVQLNEDTPVVPEFGIGMLVLTALSSLGVFAFIRM